MSDPGLPAERTGVARPLLLVCLGLGALAAELGFAWRLGQPDPAPQAAALSAPQPPPPPAAAKPASADPPGFDIVRISPRGDAVLAGHAAPGAVVAIQDGGKEIGRTTADGAGSWVLVPSAPLPPGAQELTLSETLADGTSIAAAGSVVMAVPTTDGTPALAVPALAVLDQPGAAPRVLQAPPGGQADKLAFAAVDYDDRGQPRFAGTAPPGAPVRVYVDNRPVGDAAADAQGRWTLSPPAIVAPGQHRLRVDQLDRHGHVTARAEVPFLREQLTAEQLGGNRVVVLPGESLWRLARRTYGNGMRYTVIYQANQAQISDPRKIYPGQALTVPPDAAKPNP